MSLNPQYEDIGKGFVQQYYAIFDDPANRANVVNFYSVSVVVVVVVVAVASVSSFPS